MWAFIEHVVTNRTTIMVFILMLASLGMLLVLLIAQFKKDSFDLRFLVVDDATGKPSIHKAGQGVALIITTWGFVYQIVHNRITDTYILLYMCWAGIEAVNRVAAARSGGGGGGSVGSTQSSYNSSPPYTTSQTYPSHVDRYVSQAPLPQQRASNYNQYADETFADDEEPVTRHADKPLRS